MSEKEEPGQSAVAGCRVQPTDDKLESQSSSPGDEPETFYDKFTAVRKWLLVLTTFLLAFTSTFSSTTLFPAIPEIAKDYNTSGEVIGFSNAAYLIASSVSPFIWSPLNQILGRRLAYLVAIIIFCLSSIGTALSPNLGCFIVMRMISSLENSYFLMAGQALIGDIFDPLHRGFAIGVFLAGTVLGPAIGPVMGAAIITSASWRIIFWLQSGMVGASFMLAFALFPELHSRLKVRDTKHVVQLFSPARIIRLFRYPNLVLIFLPCGTLSFGFYSLLTPIRYVLNPRFNLNSPIQSGLFYLAPGFGLVIGSALGGRWADTTVKRYIEKRGVRIPEDRLRAGLWFTGLVSPIGFLMYGWSVQHEKGGMAVPIVGMVLTGMAQMAGFSALNTYCAEIKPQFSAEIIGGKYAVQYLFSAAGSATTLPFVQKIGIGWATTICAAIIEIGTLMVLFVCLFGTKMREKIDASDEKKRSNTG